MTIAKPCKNCGRSYSSEADFLQNTSGWRVCDKQSLWFECSCCSTLMLPKGKYPWYSPENAMSPEASALLNRLTNIKALPHLPHQLMNLQQVARDPNADVSELTVAIRKDPAMAARILGVVDTIRSARGEKSRAQSLEHAIVFLGRRYVADLALMTVVHDFTLGTKVFSAQDFWHHAYLTGAVAEALCSRVLGGEFKDEAYICGALCNVGKLVAAICVPEQVDAIKLATRNPRGATSWTTIEKKIGAYPHTTLGEIAGALWGLPRYVTEICAAHHTVRGERLPVYERDHQRIAVVSLANQLTHWLLFEPERIEQEVLTNASLLLGVDEKKLEILCADMMSLKSSVQELINTPLAS